VEINKIVVGYYSRKQRTGGERCTDRRRAKFLIAEGLRANLLRFILKIPQILKKEKRSFEIE
jgi:hypothetical protein